MPAPLSVTRIYVESLRLWRAHFLRLTILAAFLEVPILLGELGLHLGTGFTIDSRRSITTNTVALPLAIYGSLSHHFLSGLLEKLVGAERHGHPNPTLREILRELPWWRLLGADLLMTVLVVVGLVAFVIPGLLVATWLTPLLVIVNLERKSVRESMKRSYELVRGHFWRVFIVGILALLVVQVAVELFSAVAHWFGDGRALTILAHAVPATLLMPMAALPIVVLTFDLVALMKSRRTSPSSSAAPDTTGPAGGAGSPARDVGSS